MSAVVRDTSYVLLGAGYLFGTPSLWKTIICPFIFSLLGGIVILVALFAGAYVPQWQSLERAGISKGWAGFLAFLLVLLEATLLTMISVLIVFGTRRQVIFNKVYKKNAKEIALANVKTLEETVSCSGRCYNECRSCGRLIWMKLALQIISLPLLLIPILGNLIFGQINGTFYSWDMHSDYFVAHGIVSFKEQKKIVKNNPFYHTFGSTALALETIPLFGLYFLFSNAAGAALYAANQDPAFKYVQRTKAVPNQNQDGEAKHEEVKDTRHIEKA